MNIRVLTFNTCHGCGIDGIIDIKRQADFLIKLGPDILLLQELDKNTDRLSCYQIQELSKELNINNYYMGINTKVFNGEYGNGIISKYEILESNNYLFSNHKNEQRGLTHIKIKIDNKIINVFSLHLSTNKDERISSIKEIIDIIKSIPKDESIILGGDFNIGIESIGVHKYIKDNKDKYKEYEMLEEYLNKIDNKETTWISATGEGCIDTIFYKNIELVDFKTIDNKVSDHSVVMCDFKLGV